MNKKCQVFTPYDKVIELLDKVGYKENLYGKKVIENACGDGNILKVIVERYIQDCLKKKLDINMIKLGLEKDIYGAEIDKKHYENCIKNLSFIAQKYNIYDVSWKIINVDILREKIKLKFDYVIGNPPYITYRDLDIETRSFVRKNYSVCSDGKFDYCYAFIEESVNILRSNGKLAYLIPNSIFKNVFGEKLREFILPHLLKIYDYTVEKVFSVLTSSAIIILEKESKKSYIEYYDVVNKECRYIDKCNLSGKWIFANINNYTPNINKKVKFGDYFTAAITIATLLNKAFVLKNYKEIDKKIKINEYEVEKEITKVAVSPRSLNYNKKERIIFPYKYIYGKVVRYEESEFNKKYPGAIKYLDSFSNELKNRKADKRCKWYEYGRSQALGNIYQKKLLISTVVTKQIKVYELSKNTIPYAGIYIIAKSNLSLDVAKNILESEDFFNYVQGIGINASGVSLRITPTDINNYEFFLE